MRGNNKVLGIVLLGLLIATTSGADRINPRGSLQPTDQTVFRIDTPAENATVFGIVDVRGYVLDARGVSRITLLVDGAAVHDVDLNQPRSDVRRKYPAFEGEPFPEQSGFATSFLGTNYTEGAHALAIRVHYSNGDIETLGSRTITVATGENQPPIGALDSPRMGSVGGGFDVVSGVYPITGWALDDEGIRKTALPANCGDPDLDPFDTCRWAADIEIMLDGQAIGGQVVFPLGRPDVANNHPDVANALLSGFQMNLDTTRYSNGTYTLSARVWDTGGLSREIGRRTISIQNNYSTAKPFGRIDWPMPNGYFFSCSCYRTPPISGPGYDPSNNIDWVSGWVVDQNDNPLEVGITNVELLLDGVVIAQTHIQGPGDTLPFGQFWFTRFGRYVNYYGIDRPDIAYLYPQFTWDAKRAGFLFAVDTDFIIDYGFPLGLHHLSVIAHRRDSARPSVEIDRIPIQIVCNENNDLPSTGALELPEVMQEVRNSTRVRGWVIDYNGGVARLNFYVDGILDGSLTGGSINIERPDVRQKYPWLPVYNARFVGFEYQLDTNRYVDGVHQLIIESVDGNGNRNYWVQRPVVFNNPN